MRNAKLVLATCAAALALSAAVTTAASAATAGWMVNGTSLTGSAAFASTAAVENSMKLEVKNSFTILCKGTVFKAAGAELVAPNKIKATSLEFTECQGTTEQCRLEDEAIRTVPIVAEAVLEGSLAVRSTLKPQTKTVIATVDFVGEACAFKGVTPITGSVLVLSPTAQDERITQQSIVAATEASGELKVGGSGALADVTGSTRLASGLPWSFL